MLRIVRLMHTYRPFLALRLSTGLWLLCASLAGARADAQPARLVKDIDGATHTGVWIGEMAAFGPSVYFGASSQASNEQLWRSDGTSDGTRKLRDFDVLGDSQPKRFTPTDSGLFFFVGAELWRVDEAGDASRVRVLPSEPGEVAVLGDTLFLLLGSRELWRSDGTPDGTVQIIDVGNFAYASGLAQAGDAVYFFVLEDNVALRLWTSDGTTGGTGPRVELGSESLWVSTALDDALIFVTSGSRVPGYPYTLWRSDGSAQGTLPIASFYGDVFGCHSICHPLGPSSFTKMGQKIFFIANEGSHGRELWSTDGSAAGTALVRDVNPGGDHGIESVLLAAEGRVFFAGRDPLHGIEVWVSDGTSAGTSLVRDVAPGPDSISGQMLGSLGHRVLFSGRTRGEIWITDGGASGTQQLVDLHSEHQAPYAFTPTPDGLLFLEPVSTGSVLWRTDGTPAGTRVVNEFPAANGAYPGLFTDVDGWFAFSPSEGPSSPFLFRELWMSDGTSEGTSLVDQFEGITQMTKFQGELYFVAWDQSHSASIQRTRGGAAGDTRLVFGPPDAYPGRLTPAGSILFFEASDRTHGRELWVTDGTSAGTRLVRDIRPGVDDSFIKPLGVLEGRLYFVTNDGVHGEELWRSDGTEAGTVLVKDIRVGPESCAFQDSTIAFGRIFFGAYDGARFRLWSTDGTTEGTYSLGPFDPHQLTTAGNLLYFTDAAASKLWRSDGTTEGTRVVREAGGNSINRLTGSSGLLYFVAEDEELWRSDGTDAGTHRVRDIRPGPEGGLPTQAVWAMTPVGNLVLFTANDGEHGMELWASDGSESGTRMIQDIAPGAPSSSPTGFLRSGGLVYFSADDGETGQELWAIPESALRADHPRDPGNPARPRTDPREVPPRP